LHFCKQLSVITLRCLCTVSNFKLWVTHLIKLLLWNPKVQYCLWTLTWASSIRSIPSHPASLRLILSIIIPSTSICPKWSLPLIFLQPKCYMHFCFPSCMLHVPLTSSSFL
jgi:hypothetical protein